MVRCNLASPKGGSHDNSVIARERSDRGNLRQGRPPFVASRHFPRFSGDIYPAIKDGAACIGVRTPIFGIASFHSQ